MKPLTTSLVLAMILPLLACNHSETTLTNENTNMVPVISGLFIPKALANYTSSNKSVVRSRTVVVDTANLLNRLSTEQVTSLPLNFFDDAVFTVVRQKQTLDQLGSVTWLGKIPSIAGSIAVLNISKDKINGSLDIPNRGLFSIRSLPEGHHLVEEINRSSIQ